MHHRFVVAVALLLPAFQASAAAIGPERPLSPPDRASAPFVQTSPDLASNGTDVLAVWLDARRSIPDVASSYSLFASRLNDAGEPLSPRGIELARNVYAAAVTSAGNDYLVAYSTLPSAQAFVLRTDGGPDVSEPRSFDQGTVIDAASTAKSHCVLLSDPGQSRFWVTILDSEGHVVRRIALADRAHAVITAGNGYLVSGSAALCDGVRACTAEVTTTRISADGRVQRNVLASGLPFWVGTAISHGLEGGLVAWIADDENLGRVTEYVLVDDDGRKAGAIARAHRNTDLRVFGLGLRPALGFDGFRYLVGVPLFAGPNTLELAFAGLRVSSSGELLDAQPIVIGDQVAAPFATTRSTRRTYLAWAKKGDIVARSLSSFAAMQDGGWPITVSTSANLQSDAAVAIMTNVALAAWRQGDATTAIAAALFDPRTGVAQRPLTIAEGRDVVYSAPAVAAGPGSFLTIWRETNGGTSRVYARRVSPAGVLLDADPLLLDDAPVSYGGATASDTAVASDGTDYLVVWRRRQELYGARVLHDGTLGGAAFPVSRDGANYHHRMSPRVAWTGSVYLVVWQFDGQNPFTLSPPLPPVMTARLARITREGVLLDPLTSPVLAQLDGTGDAIALAAGKGRAMALFTHSGVSNCIYRILLTKDGQPVSAIASVDCNADGPPVRNDVALSWDGEAFVGVWSSDGQPMNGARMATSGTVFERFQLSAAAQPAWGASLAPSFGGTVAAYSRIADEAAFGSVGRIFVRTIGGGDAPPIPRRRTVRR